MQITPAQRRAAVRGAAGGLAAGVVVAAASFIGLGALTAVVPVALIVAVVIAAVMYLKSEILLANRATARELTTRLRTINGRLPEISAIASFSAIDTPYPLPLGGHWSLAWDAAAVLAREVALRQPRTVVELGSGASSLVIGMQLRRLGHGHLYTLDHDPEFARLTRRHLAAMGLQDWVSVLDSALVDQSVGGEQYSWYDLPEAVRSLERIDVVVIDGPPQRTDREGMPRYPALPMLADQLGPGSLVFVDDASRDAEKRMMARWATEQPQWVHEHVKTQRGTALLRWPDQTAGLSADEPSVPAGAGA
jgi:predicted O-methyltransferase YrrM